MNILRRKKSMSRYRICCSSNWGMYGCVERSKIDTAIKEIYSYIGGESIVCSNKSTNEIIICRDTDYCCEVRHLYNEEVVVQHIKNPMRKFD